MDKVLILEDEWNTDYSPMADGLQETNSTTIKLITSCDLIFRSLFKKAGDLKLSSGDTKYNVQRPEEGTKYL